MRNPASHPYVTSTDRYTHPMATGLLADGPNPPEVISPISVCPSGAYILVCARAGAFIPEMPTRFIATGFSFPSASRILSAPRNPCSNRLLLFGPPTCSHTARACSGGSGIHASRPSFTHSAITIHSSTDRVRGLPFL